MTDGPETPPNYEEQFAHRFSLEDAEYQQYVSRPANPPPLVEDWCGRGGGNNRGRDNRSQDRGGYRGRGWGGDRDRGETGTAGGQGPRRGRDRGGDRRYGQGGGGHQSGRYNSYNQRPSHYDRY
ncbi:RNA guanine-N7 methyltransferase-activating subunit-like protein [Salvelinus sp. IW2-2015]|uniref:RNA guanine-N7 methyltransferase-activating subunit-like protein n=1 Tax=Salvelinus sp. IW2-2015 TaxID=2691554 RepID=UPI000CEAC064|nr:RNMT-activating mini protein [Salvelinus alpinus]